MNTPAKSVLIGRQHEQFLFGLENHWSLVNDFAEPAELQLPSRVRPMRRRSHRRPSFSRRRYQHLLTLPLPVSLPKPR